MKLNILILSILFSVTISTGLMSQDMKILPDGVIIPKGDHTIVPFPENGQMIYDNITKSVWYYNGTIWKEVGSDNLGDHSATDTLDMAGFPIENLPSPVNNMDAANKAYIDAHEDMDADTLNEIQTLSASVEGDTLYLSKSNWLIVPGISDANHIKDFDGNVYTEVVIGDQTWLKENLRAIHYNDGTPIPKIDVATDWDDWNASWDGSQYTDVYDAYNWFNSDSTTYSKFGALYNWGVVDSTINGGKNACPVGYEVPTEADLDALILEIGGNIAGLYIKYPPGEWWQASQDFPFGGNGDNSSGFSATGTGFISEWDGTFNQNKQTSHLWSRTGSTSQDIHSYRIRYDDWEVTERVNESGGEGYTIRCIKIE